MGHSKMVRETKVGYRTNSMYEPNSVDCEATPEQRERFYVDSEKLNIGAPKLIKKKRKTYELGSLESLTKPSLIIEI